MGANVPKYLLISLNFIVFLCGGIIFVAGLLLKLESGFLEDEVKSLFNRISYNGVYMGAASDALAYMMMVFGGIIMVVSLVGGCGAWNKIRKCLLVYAILVIVMILAEAVLVGFWVSARTRYDEWLKGRMLDQFKSYAGPTETDVVSSGWNTLFMTAECCGVNAQYYNGGTNNDFTEFSTTWSNSRGTQNLPATCCMGVMSDTISSYKNSDCTNTPKNFYTTGCYDRVKGYIDTYSLIVLITVGVAFAVEVVAIISACLVMSAINKITHA